MGPSGRLRFVVQKLTGTWTQVRVGLDPRAFNVRTVPTLLSRSRAWAGLR